MFVRSFADINLSFISSSLDTYFGECQKKSENDINLNLIYILFLRNRMRI